MTRPIIPQTREEWDAWGLDVQRSLESGREAVLGRMGYGSYDEYRASYLWRKIKKPIFAQYEGKCFRCGGPATYVHHRSYREAVLEGDDDDQLRPLCAGCHHIVEFDDEGKWRTSAEKDRVLFEQDVWRDYARPILDMRGKKVKILNPPNFQRMNTLQREAWFNEYHWIAFTTRSPDLPRTNPDSYSRLKNASHSTSKYGIGEPVPPKIRRPRGKAM